MFNYCSIIMACHGMHAVDDREGQWINMHRVAGRQNSGKDLATVGCLLSSNEDLLCGALGAVNALLR